MNNNYSENSISSKLYLDLARSAELRKQVDELLNTQINKWNMTVLDKTSFANNEVYQQYFQRHMTETVWRIRLLRIAESKALVKIAWQNPRAALIWENYEQEEMLLDEMFIQDLEKTGVSRDEFLNTEPYPSTKLQAGFFSFLLDHEGPLGIVVYSYLVEYFNVEIGPKKVRAVRKIIGEEEITGRIAYSQIGINGDHASEIWAVIRHLLKDESDIERLFYYLIEHQQALSRYFHEIYQDMIEPQAVCTVDISKVSSH